MADRFSQPDDHAAAWGRTLAASPIIRELADIARAASEEGLPDEVVRKRVRAHAERIGLASWRFLLPSVNREALRLPFPVFIRALGNHYAKHTRHKRVRDFLDSITAKFGIDDWVVDCAVSMARTGKSVPMGNALLGGVHVQHMTFGDEPPVDVVIAGATAASDFRAIAEEFVITCERTFPAAAQERPRNQLRDATWFFDFHSDMSDAEIAWAQLADDNPRDIVYENPKYADEHRRLTATIKQARKRHFDRVTEILDPLSPDNQKP